MSPEGDGPTQNGVGGTNERYCLLNSCLMDGWTQKKKKMKDYLMSRSYNNRQKLYTFFI